ncbi:MAG: hypothetical protein HY236_08365, partial [Acidobacteria bacterium]|nr:hypothetical protein [Acidobacteriota bacterium]
MKAPRSIFVVAWFTISAMAQSSQSGPLELERTIPLPKVEGRIDHMTVDLGNQRLFVAALENNTVEVLDLGPGRRIYTIRGLNEPQGLVYLFELEKIVVANGGDGACRYFDGRSFRPLNVVQLPDDADNVRYDAVSKRLYVGYGKGALGILDAATGQRLGDIKLEGHPESFQLEKYSPRIFVNVPTAGHVAVVDREKRVVAAKWPVPQAAENFPMALDEADHRLFIGCRKPGVVLVLETVRGQVVARLNSAGDADDL